MMESIYTFKIDLGSVIIIFMMIFLIVNFFLLKDKDSTDSEKGRSGLILHIDNLTGCHYLSVPFSGITPRLDKDGKHICDKKG